MGKMEIEKKKILISFLGAGNYKQVKYKINGFSFESQLALVPLIKFFQPDLIYVIGTKDSSWHLLKGLNYTTLEIPGGKNAEEFWEMFDLVLKKIEVEIKNSKIAFDITHCFRSIPFFVVILTKCIKFIEESAEISHIFYGYLDRLANESDIIDLQPLLELLDWLEAISSLKKYGDVYELCRLIERTEKEIRKTRLPTKDSYLKKLRVGLKKLNDISRMTFVPHLWQIADNISNIIYNDKLLSEVSQYIKPFRLILPDLQNLAERFKKDTVWESMLEVSRWYLENKNPTQALIVLRETIVTYEADKKGWDVYDINNRKNIEDELNAKRTTSSSPIHKLWNKVIDPRNNVAHALMKKVNKNINPNKAMDNVQRLVNDVETYLKGNN